MTDDPTPPGGSIRPTGAEPPPVERTQVLPVTFAVADEAVPPAAPAQPAQPMRRRRSPWRVVLVALVVVLVAGGIYYLVSLYQVWSTGRTDQARPVDAIVVLGAAQYDGTPSPQLAGRLDQVVRLWPQGYAPLVVTTGGNRPGDRFTEAQASAAYLADRGVPAESIVQVGGSTTYESLEAVADALTDRGLESVLIVTDPYHALRSRMIAEELGLEAYVSPTTTSVVTGRSSLVRHLREALGVALARPIGFDRLRGLAG